MNGIDILIEDLKDVSEILKEKKYGGWNGSIQKTIRLLKKQEEEIKDLRQTTQCMIGGICLLKEQEEKPLWCEKCSYHREDGLCSMHRIYVAETDYCSLGAWEGR